MLTEAPRQEKLELEEIPSVALTPTADVSPSAESSSAGAFCHATSPDLSSARRITSSDELKRGGNAPSTSRAVFQELIVVLFTAVHLPNILQGSSIGLRSSLIPIFGKALGGSDTMIGVVTAMAGLGRIVSGFPAGRLTSRHGFVYVMSLGMFVNVLGAIICASAWNNIVLGLANLIFGLGIGLFYTSRHVMLSIAVDKSKRGRLMSLLGGGERWSSVIGPACGGIIIEYGSARWCAIAVLPMVLMVVFCIKRSHRVQLLDEKYCADMRLRDALEAHDGPNKASNRDLVPLLREYGHLLVRVGVYSMNVIQLRACRKLMLPLAAINAGLSPSMVGLVLSVSFAVDATLFFLGGLVMDRFGRKYSAIPTTINLGISFLMLSFSKSTWSLFAVAIVFGFADSLGAGLLLTMNADHAPKRAGAEFMGLMRVTQDAGQLLGPLFAGILSNTFSFSFACLFLGGLGIANAVWAVLMLPSDPADEDTAAMPSVVTPESAKTSSSVVDIKKGGSNNQSTISS